MRTATRTIGPLLVVLLSTLISPASAQVHPVLERGFSPEGSYHAGDVDSVNLFNGNLVVSLPIGPTYPVGGRLAYGFVLTYNSLFWDHYADRDATPNCPRDPDGRCEPRESLPSRFDNAGLGWRLSLGDLAGPGSIGNWEPNWLYVAPDGSRHAFSATLHEGEASHPGVWYTRDNSYLRLAVLEEDGSGSLVRMSVEGPEGITRIFARAGEDWRLELIRDRFGNQVGVTYTTDRLTFTDSTGRTQKVHFTTVAGRRVVSRVELTAFAGATAVYRFEYANAPTGVVIEEHCLDYVGQENLAVALLTAVTLPDGSRYVMKDPAGQPSYLTANGTPSSHYNACVPRSGVLTRLVLPTGGVHEWEYGPVHYPNGGGGCGTTRDEWLYPVLSTGTGVTRRTVTALPGRSAIWEYEYQLPTYDAAPSVTRTATSPDGHDTVHHFNTEQCNHSGTQPAEWGGWAYGLPFAPLGDSSGMMASIEHYEGTGASRVLRRVQSVRYEHDELPALTPDSGQSWYNSNRRVAATAVSFRDDVLGGGVAATAQTVYSDFDGLGHYRKVERSGFGSSTTRTGISNFNPGRGTYGIDSGNRRVGNFTMLDPQSVWLLDVFDYTTQKQGSATAKQEYCFDPADGRLLRTRMLKSGTVRSGGDLLARFEYDNRGNLSAEYAYGGDRHTIGTGALCALALPAPEYGVLHTYAYGVRKKTQYAGTTVNVIDADVDRYTGLVLRKRDVAGFATTMSYDGMGRVTGVTPAAGARVTVSRTLAIGDVTSAAFSPPGIEVSYQSQAGAGQLSAEGFTFDGLGRLTAERRLLADGSWAVRLNEYTPTGHTARMSEWKNESALPAWTTYAGYDAFGRARTVTGPDGAVTRFDYAGDRLERTTVSIGTGLNGSTVAQTAFTTEVIRDHMGRVVQVFEPLSAVQQATSRYEYDVAGRLAKVTLTVPEGTQVREFRYDNRGFLVSEKHPEKGSSGNGLTSYLDYDARGHPWRLEDGPNRLSFVYDAAGRMTEIREAAGAQRVLEQRVYGTSSSGGNFARGKLVEAKRHNFYDGVNDLRVSEKYAYRGVGGRVSERTTQAGIVSQGSDVTFLQNFAWTELGTLRSQSYPQFGSIGASRTVEFVYTNGYLTSVPGYANDISYHPSGMIYRVTHGNGVVDYRTGDPTGMARPGKLYTQKASANWSSGAFVYDGAGNIVGIGGDRFLYDGASRLVEGTAIRTNGTRGTQRYTYDGFGNLTKVWTDGLGSRTIGIFPATNRLTGAGYDAAGNQLSWGSGSLAYEYAYSPFNQIRQISGGSPPVIRYYAYAPGGERIASYASDSDVITYTLRDLGGRVLRDYDLRSATGEWSWRRDYVWSGDDLLATEDWRDGTRHYHLDHLGTPRLVTGTGRVKVARHNYYPFGEEATDPEQQSSRIRFTGHERDLNLPKQTTDDLDYMHARHFSPSLARFMSVDPVGGMIGSSQSWNRYAYVRGNPINLTDPRGLTDDERSEPHAARFEDTIEVTADLPEVEIFTIVVPPLLPPEERDDRLRVQVRHSHIPCTEYMMGVVLDPLKSRSESKFQRLLYLPVAVVLLPAYTLAGFAADELINIFSLQYSTEMSNQVDQFNASQATWIQRKQIPFGETEPARHLPRLSIYETLEAGARSAHGRIYRLFHGPKSPYHPWGW